MNPRRFERETFVVIPAYEGGEDLVACVRSVVQGEVVPRRIIVVDNASSDDSLARVSAEFPQVDVVRNPVNVGFGAACNAGIALARADGAAFVLLLNQDALLGPGTLASALRLASERPRAGAIGPTTLSPARDPDGRCRLLYDGAWCRCLPLWQRIPGIGEPVDRLHDGTVDREPCEVDFVWGHAMLLRLEALEAIGDFDPDFFMYYEDLDLCDRLQRGGWQLWCDRRGVVWHAVDDAERASSSDGWRWQMKQESIRRYFRKRSPPVRADALWLLSTVREFGGLLQRRRWQAACHLTTAMWRVARGAPEARPPGRRGAADRESPKFGS